MWSGRRCVNSTRDRINGFFENFQSSAFRLEVHQTYTMPNEQADFNKFLAGEPKPSNRKREWRKLVGAKLASGATMRRAKVLVRPLTDYSNFLVSWGIPENIEAGEDYRIIDQAGKSIGIPSQDFWLFDDRTVLLLNFRNDGTLIDRKLIEGENIDQYRQWRDLAWDNGVPFHEWNAGA